MRRTYRTFLAAAVLLLLALVALHQAARVRFLGYRISRTYRAVELEMEAQRRLILGKS